MSRPGARCAEDYAQRTLMAWIAAVGSRATRPPCHHLVRLETLPRVPTNCCHARAAT
jgi:hypothetical protein